MEEERLIVWILFTFFKNGLLEGCAVPGSQSGLFKQGLAAALFSGTVNGRTVFSIPEASDQVLLWFISGNAIGKIKQSAWQAL